MSELTLKISVDTTDLDKVEAQLKRINDLLVSAGMKKSESVGFTSDTFFIANGQVFIDAPFITSATISIAKVTREDKLQEENVWRGGVKVEQECSVAQPNVIAESALANAQEMVKVISKSEREREEREWKIEQQFSELQSQITSTQIASVSDIDMLSARIADLECSLSANNQSTAQYLSGLQRQVTELSKETEEAKLKGSLNAINIISIKQTMEQQEKSLAETITKTVVADLCRGGSISRTL